MNIFTLYATLCYFSIFLTNNDFPIQNIDYNKNQIIACQIPQFNVKYPQYCEIYYVKIHYEFNQYWYFFYKESAIFDKRMKCIYRDFENYYDTDSLFKPIINFVEITNGNL